VLEFGSDVFPPSMGQHGGRTIYADHLAPGRNQHGGQVSGTATYVENALTFQELDDSPTWPQEYPAVNHIAEF
jgi:hypothetical protein